MTQENLEAKREQLEELEKSEQAARRLEEALGRGRTGAEGSRANGTGEDSTGTSPPGSGLSGGEPSRGERGDNGYLPPHPGPNPVRRRAPGMGFLSALSYTLHGMMDVDPVTARRNAISKSREQISLVSLSSFDFELFVVVLCVMSILITLYVSDDDVGANGDCSSFPLLPHFLDEFRSWKMRCICRHRI